MIRNYLEKIDISRRRFIQFIASASLASAGSVVPVMQAQAKSVARYLRVQVQMVLGYHQNVSPAKTILSINGSLALQNAKGAVVGISPYDYAAWTSTLNNK